MWWLINGSKSKVFGNLLTISMVELQRVFVDRQFIIFLAGLRPRPLGRKEHTLWREAKGFLVRGLGRGANPFPIRVHAKRESLLLGCKPFVTTTMLG